MKKISSSVFTRESGDEFLYQLSRAIDKVPQPQREAFLSRLVILLAISSHDSQSKLDAITLALKDISI
ncbi:MAG: hypothetical protein QM538_05085 [Methylacidiphilales bacterium]|nr:hypothetical protein [Candidatus Methylacidiphilales bacterium]